jgi:hypothetical protein
VARKSALARLIKTARVNACLLRLRVLGPQPMQLSDEQMEEVRRWAERNPRVSLVRLFGSRAMGCARQASDVDLALTLTGTQNQVFSYHMA